MKIIYTNKIYYDIIPTAYLILDLQYVLYKE